MNVDQANTTSKECVLKYSGKLRADHLWVGAVPYIPYMFSLWVEGGLKDELSVENRIVEEFMNCSAERNV